MSIQDPSNKVINLNIKREQKEGQSRRKPKHTRGSNTRVIAITSGKGGVGKTSIVANLGYAFNKLGKKVLIFDADLGLGNLDVLLGLAPKYNLSHVIMGEKTIEEILISGPSNMKILPAASGIQELTNLTRDQKIQILTQLDHLIDSVDVLFIDTAAGINDSVINFSRAAGEVIVVVCDEPASIADAYALIKVLSRDYSVNKVHVICNQVESKAHGEVLLNQIVKVINKFLDVSINYLGSIPEDAYLRKAVKRQVAVTTAYPRCRAAEAFRAIAEKLAKSASNYQSSGNMEFFVEQLVGYNKH